MGVIHKLYHTTGQGLPLGADINFNCIKIIFLDIALTQPVLNMEIAFWILRPLEQIINRGVVAEAFVGQELIAGPGIDIKPQLYITGIARPALSKGYIKDEHEFVCQA